MNKTRDKVNQLNQAEAGGPEEEVLDLVHWVMHQYRSQQYQVLRDGPYDITHMESKVLGFFGHHPGSTQSDIAKHSGRDKAQLARLIKALRERGLLTGEADAVDRRNLRLTLTEAGQAVLQVLSQEAKQVSQRAVAGFAPEELASLLLMLGRMKANLS